MTDEKPVIGVDLGGTKVLSAVVGAQGEILSRAKVRTQADSGVVKRMVIASNVARFITNCSSASFGFGT